MKNREANRLITERSPYLLQHAKNPVDWFPWNDEAFNKAHTEDKPIFLSIGYSTCHWCHVMEKESFEDEDVAEILNNSFISIKVDREERPDIDHIYMKVCQLMTGSGGWPLSVFLTPDKKPFFAGTYFPKENKYGRIGFVELLNRVSELWKEKKYELTNSADEITSTLTKTDISYSQSKPGKDIIHNAFSNLAKLYDPDNGGFGSAPKFPSPHNLMFLLRYWKKYENSNALEMVNNTLTQMRMGGIYDQIGFGFHRYSTDANWLVPHFEKMLYDQAMLIIAYSETYQATKNDLFKRTVEEIVEYLKTNLLSPEGGFYSAEDADSEGEEGKFYVWSIAEVNNLLDADEAELFSKTYNITEHGNFKDESTGIMNGLNIPHLTKPIEDDNEKTLLNNIRQKLLSRRSKRIHPFKDDKTLTDWNGLMIAALSTAANVFDNFEYLTLALKCKEFVFSKMIKENNELLHRYRNNESGIKANLDDYSFLIWGLLALYNSTFDEQHLIDAINLTETTIKIFWDKSGGGFYFSNSSSSDLIIRTKEFYDSAIPSGNSVMLHNLIILSRITTDNKYEYYIQKMVDPFLNNVSHNPNSSTFALTSFIFLFEPSYELIIVGDNTNAKASEYVKTLGKYFAPDMITIFKNIDTTSMINYINNYKIINGQTTFYLCLNHACDVPTNDIAEIIKQIS